MPKEDHGVLIISAAAVVSFLTCLLCILCQRKRKRRHHRQLHRNAHYDSTTSATGKELDYLLYLWTDFVKDQAVDRTFSSLKHPFSTEI